MKIAQIAPLIESVPPKLYGGTERVVSYLTEELVRQGHDVTLFASGDSVTSAKLVPCCPRALRLNTDVLDTRPYYIRMINRIRPIAATFDVLHFHIDLVHFSCFHDIANRTVTTLHGRQDVPEIAPVLADYPSMPLVSISDAQRAPIPNASFLATIYHGIAIDRLKLTSNPQGGYLAFLGRISPEKRVDRAIRIARSIGLPLKIAAKVDRVDASYFESMIRPMIDGVGVEFIGEIDEQTKQSFLGEARALLFPIDWPEPFGMVMIEAMACGTPVLAFRNGSVSEVIDEGVTGFIVDSEDQALCRMGALLALDRNRVRRCFEQRFTATRMAADYMKAYKRLLRTKERHEPPMTVPAASP